MRPDILNPLFAPVSSLEGVGPKLEKALTRLLRGSDHGEPARIANLLSGPESPLRRFLVAAAKETTLGAIKPSAAVSVTKAVKGKLSSYKKKLESAMGSSIAFLHPKDTGGVLTELVQAATKH